jgi:uncharacterized protein YraI
MIITRLTGLAAALTLLGATPAAAAPAYVLSTVNLRAGPATTNEIVTKIPAGSLIEANNCKDGWCEVVWQGKNGYAIATALDLSGKVPMRRAVQPIPGRYVDVEPAPIMVGPPVYYYGYRPYGYYRPWGYRPWGYRGYYRRW